MKKLFILFLLATMAAMPVLAQSSPQVAPQEQQDDNFTQSMSRMLIAMMERALVEMKKNMLGDEKTKCECQCRAVPEAST
ncbi:MAG TPA: hypothetical protein PKW15_08320 [Alphaproteobacteria bacterium]|nr:hypothetical protein [Rhodospirillaceae bacterium]HRJ13230.1 hypothetical protein [Alphaproteobacteria bacterium]